MEPRPERIVRELELAPNPEGGWFRLTHASTCTTDADPTRPVLTTIYYLLSAEHPLCYLHLTGADTIHFFHHGAPMEVHVLTPAGELRRHTLGSAPGQHLQLMVPGGCWKAFALPAGAYSLISEAVVPGWIAADQRSAEPSLIEGLAEPVRARLVRFVRRALP
ncbi:MAG: cupin domain-containing protein [Pseudomonadota bacterium]